VFTTATLPSSEAGAEVEAVTPEPEPVEVEAVTPEPEPVEELAAVEAQAEEPAAEVDGDEAEPEDEEDA
jgi:hypothetical protein